MEFLRFGSSIPGGYWGCCAVCIIQNFKYDPSDKASIQLVSGDGGYPMLDPKTSSAQFAGPTYEDIFKTRLRIGTFSNQDMPNHVFLAVLTESQINGGVGKKWLAILKREGFEFIRTTDNSVYTGPNTEDSFKTKLSSHKNYIFGLFRNIGQGLITDPFTPPKAWTDLEDPYSGDMSPENAFSVQRKLWDTLGKPTFFTEQELEAQGVPITYAGQRIDGAAPETKTARQAREKAKKASAKTAAKASASKAAPWG